MDPQIIAAIVTVGLTITGGIFGYFYREYLNRVQPFISTTSVQGDFRNSGSMVHISEDIIKATKTSFYLHKIDADDNLDAIKKLWDETMEILESGPEFIHMADKIIEAIDADDQNDVQNLIAKVLSYTTINMWIVHLYYSACIIWNFCVKRLDNS